MTHGIPLPNIFERQKNAPHCSILIIPAPRRWLVLIVVECSTPPFIRENAAIIQDIDILIDSTVIVFTALAGLIRHLTPF
jgi:hypothetical protein